MGSQLSFELGGREGAGVVNLAGGAGTNGGQGQARQVIAAQASEGRAVNAIAGFQSHSSLPRFRR